MKLVERSFGITGLTLARRFHTSNYHYNQENSSSDNSNDPNKKNDDKKKREHDDKIKSLFTKAVLWMLTVYMFIAVASLIVPKKNVPETSTRYVSWKEFVHHMLAVGEVKEIILRPDMEMVTIILHDGAIIKGRRADSTVFHMAIADATKFENKLRDAESRLNVKDAVPVTYERNNDIASRILLPLILFAIIFSLVNRAGGGKSPLGMDTFVSTFDSYITK